MTGLLNKYCYGDDQEVEVAKITQEGISHTEAIPLLPMSESFRLNHYFLFMDHDIMHALEESIPTPTKKCLSGISYILSL